MQGKGAGPVNRVELESQVLCAALRQSSHVKDKIGAFTSVRELSHLFPDLLPPPERDDEQSSINKSNYYALLQIKPQTAANGVLSSYLRAVRRFLRTRRVSEGRVEFSHILNAGFVLRKPRLRLSHDLVVARRWLHEESRREAAGDITLDHIPAIMPESLAAPVAAQAPPVEEPMRAPAAPPAAPNMPPPLPATPPMPPSATAASVGQSSAIAESVGQSSAVAESVGQSSAVAESVGQSSAIAESAGRSSASPQPVTPVVTAEAPPPAFEKMPAAAPVTATSLSEQPVPPVLPSHAVPSPSPQATAARSAEKPALSDAPAKPLAEFVEPPPLSPLAARLTQPPDSDMRSIAFPDSNQAPASRPITTPEAPPPPAPKYEAAPKPAPPPQPAAASAPQEKEDLGGVQPASVRAQAQIAHETDVPQNRPPGRISKGAGFVFDESQLRKPAAPDEKPLPMLVSLLEAAQVIGSVEVQALKAQIERAPNVPVERHILNAGYITEGELASVRLGENLLQRGKITMAQFQVAFYDERYSGLRMAESLQVRGWLSVEVRNAIDEFKNKSR